MPFTEHSEHFNMMSLCEHRRELKRRLQVKHSCRNIDREVFLFSRNFGGLLASDISIPARREQDHRNAFRHLPQVTPAR